MTDQTIPGVSPEDVEAARSFVSDYLDATYFPDRVLAVARVLNALLPAPPRPTLADMTEEERAACQWMQAEVHDMPRLREGVLVRTDQDCGYVLDNRGETWFVDHAKVTPRPGLPRMEWPGTEKPAPSLPGGWRLADHEKRGRVIVTNLTPNAVGHVAYVLPATDPLGYDWLFCDPDELTYIDTTPAPVKVGDTIESADDPRLAALPVGSILVDRDGGAFEVTKADTGEWGGIGYVPVQGTGTKWGPWTVRRIGKKADQ